MILVHHTKIQLIFGILKSPLVAYFFCFPQIAVIAHLEFAPIDKLPVSVIPIVRIITLCG